MGGKVIKINLVGAIVTIILIIAAIVGIVIFVNRPKEENKGDENKIKIQRDVSENNENYNELDTSDYVMINNEKKELLMRRYISKKGYAIEYDVNNFYIDEKNNCIKSLVSDFISINLLRVDESYNDLAALLNTDSSIMKMQNQSYDFKETSLGNKNVIIEQMANDAIIIRTYYVQTEKGFIKIEAKCAKEFTDTTFPIIDKMVASVEIM